MDHRRTFLSTTITKRTFSCIVLAVLALILAYVKRLHSPDPGIHLQVQEVSVRLWPKSFSDEARLKMKITADLRPYFSWTTAQLYVFVNAEYEKPKYRLNQQILWNLFVDKKDDAKFQVQTENMFRLVDYGGGLRGLKFNLTMTWYATQIPGWRPPGPQWKVVVSGFRFPSEYTP